MYMRRKCLTPVMKSPDSLKEQYNDRERRHGSSLCGKRLRSVSLEKLSIAEIETKKISLCAESSNTPDTELAGENEGQPLLTSSPGNGTEPEGV